MSQTVSFFCQCFSTKSPTEAIFVCLLDTTEQQVEEGRCFMLSPPIPLTYSQLREAFVLCWRKCIVRPSAPFHLPTCPPAAQCGLKRLTADVGGSRAVAEEEGGSRLLRTGHCVSARWTHSHLCLWRDTSYI